MTGPMLTIKAKREEKFEEEEGHFRLSARNPGNPKTKEVKAA